MNLPPVAAQSDVPPKRIAPVASFQYHSNNDLLAFLTQRHLELNAEHTATYSPKLSTPTASLDNETKVVPPIPAATPRREPENVAVGSNRNNDTELEQYRQLSEIRRWRDDIRKQLNVSDGHTE